MYNQTKNPPSPQRGRGARDEADPLGVCAMVLDYMQIPAIAALSADALGNELSFTFPEILEVIRLCSANQLAVLGFEIHEVHADGYYTKKLSAYEWPVQTWSDYVRVNNASAEEFVRQNPHGDDHVYVPTIVSEREIQRNQEL